MGYTIVSGNKPSPVAQYQQSCNIIQRNALIKCQICIINLNLPKPKWGGAEDPTIKNFYKIDNRKF